MSDASLPPPERAARILDSLGLADHPQVRAALANSTSPFSFHQVRRALRASGVRVEALAVETPLGRRWQDILQQVVGAPLLNGAGELGAEAEDLGELEPAVDMHQAMEVLLVEHRLALMSADVDRAREGLARFRQAMLHHIEVEEGAVLPAYTASEPAEGWARGAAPFIFDNEHGKIRRWLDDLAGMVDQLAGCGLDGPELRVKALEILDREKVFQDILEHHDLRERAHLYPRLKAVFSPDQQSELVGRFMVLPRP